MDQTCLISNLKGTLKGANYCWLGKKTFTVMVLPGCKNGLSGKEDLFVLTTQRGWIP